MDALFFDCEIARAIPDTGVPREPGLEYCNGWGDHKGMGVAVVGCFDALERKWHAYSAFCPVDISDRYDELVALYNVHCVEPLADFAELVSKRKEIIGFNSVSFDDKLLRANGIDIKTTYDLLCEVRVASGQPAGYVKGLTRKGYTLGELSERNLGQSKLESGEKAPKLWQRGEKGRVVLYCLDDVAKVVDLFHMRDAITDPTNGSLLRLARSKTEQNAHA